MPKFIVEQRNDLTAYCTFQEDDDNGGPFNEVEQTFEFDTFEEAEQFYISRKRMLRFAGLKGQYYTFPSELDEHCPF